MLGKTERLILAFLDEPCNEDLLLQEFSPWRFVEIRAGTLYVKQEHRKTRAILSRMIGKGLIKREGDIFYKI